jgi:O-antigen/teichoic acid export membrane protein
MGGYAGEAALRFVGNLILSRLLFPEAYGIMALVGAFYLGIGMFSDLGIGLSIIQSDRGEEDSFVNTAFTLQALRGILLWLISIPIALLMAQVYSEPDLILYLPVMATAFAIGGFKNPRLFLLQRSLYLSRIVLSQLLGRGAGLVAMIVAGVLYPSVWVLILGSVVGWVMQSVLSFVLIPSRNLKLEWHWSMAREIVTFGGWIFISSVAGFLGTQGDKLILGKFFTKGDLGCYNFAFFLGTFFFSLVNYLAQRVIFPTYVKLKHRDPAHIRGRVLRLRGGLMLLCLPIQFTLMLLGTEVFRFLYDPRYLYGGWMLQILAGGAVVATLTATLDPVFLALGDSFRLMVARVLQVVFLVTSMFIGGAYWGAEGLVAGIAVSHLFTFTAVVLLARRYHVWAWKLDIPVLVATAAVAFASWHFRPVITGTGASLHARIGGLLGQAAGAAELLVRILLQEAGLL